MKKSILAVAVFATFVGGGHAAEYALDASSANASQAVSNSDVITSIKVSSGYTADVTGKAIVIKGTDLVIDANTDNRPTDSSSKLVIGTTDTDSVTISQVGNPHKKQVLCNRGSETEIHGKTIVIDYSGGGEAVRTKGYGSLTIGGTETESVHLTSNGDGLVLLPYDKDGNGQAKTDGKLTVTASKEIVIDAKDYGLWAQNNSTGSEGNYAKATLTAESVRITAGQAAIVAMSQADVEINGNTYIKAEDAILTRGLSKVTINKSGTGIVQMEGNLNFNYDENTSKTTVDATVDVTLSGKDSFWNGNVVTEWGDKKPDNEEKLVVKSSNLTLKDGAQWIATEVTNDPTRKYTALNNLSIDGGVINVTQGAQTLEVEKITGSGGTILVTTSESENGEVQVARKIEIGEAAKSTNLTVTDPKINADTVKDSAKTMAALKSAVSTTSGEITQTNRIEEGAVKGAITETVVGGESQGVEQGQNSKLAAFNSVTAMGTMAWRHDMNDLTKRMGELRTSPEGIGSWVRLYGSEQEYGRQDVTTKSTSVQVGSDYDVGYGWKVGGAFTYTDGSSDYANGSSDNKAYGLAAYGSWLHEGGAFVDVIAKYSRLKSDFDMSVMSGTSKNNAYSASAEFGWYVPFANVAFVEPQAEITYGVVKGDDFTTSNGVAISQKDTKALIGRLGVRTGLHFNENKGVVYARASVLRDFKGESEFTASLVSDSSVCSTVKDDIGGTYYEMGIGANYKFADNAYTYVDFERQNGGDVKEKWRWNVGLRYVW